jgi:hypothetical protein
MDGVAAPDGFDAAVEVDEQHRPSRGGSGEGRAQDDDSGGAEGVDDLLATQGTIVRLLVGWQQRVPRAQQFERDVASERDFAADDALVKDQAEDLLAIWAGRRAPLAARNPHQLRLGGAASSAPVVWVNSRPQLWLEIDQGYA